MNARTHIIVAITLIAGGAVAGHMISDKRNGEVVEETSHVSSPRDHRTGKSVSKNLKNTEDKKDLVSLIERRKEKTEALGPVGSAMERLSAASLKNLALEQIAALVAMENDGEDAKVARGVLDASIKELWKREGLAALDWAADLEGKTDRAILTDGLLQNALGDNPSAVFPWMEKHRSEIRRVFSSTSFISIAMTAAVEHGVDDIVKAYEMFPGSNLINPLHSAIYPPDFDFAALYKGLHGKTDLNPALSEWVLRDENAAWDAVKGSLEKGNSHFFMDTPVNAMTMARIAQDGEKEGVAWMLEKLSSLSPEIQRNQLLSNRNEFQLSKVGISMIAASLEPDARIDYALQTLRKNGVNEKSLVVLEMMPREDVLVALKRKNNDPIRAEIKADLISRYQFTEEELGNSKEDSTGDAPSE